VTRTAWLALLGAALLGLGALAIRNWPSSASSLSCDASDVRWLDAGGVWIARCAPELPRDVVPPGAARLIGTRFDLNTATEQELAEIPGIGAALAHALVAGRTARNGFRSWEEVDGVPGVGPAKLKLLQDVAEIRP
jgi:competence protein ComEA